jgi:hypothetical protein
MRKRYEVVVRARRFELVLFRKRFWTLKNAEKQQRNIVRYLAESEDSGEFYQDWGGEIVVEKRR